MEKKRKSISAKQRLKLFMDHDGVCHICGGKITVGEAWHVEHVVPLALGGDDEEANWRPAHSKCHKGKTKTDVTAVAKAKRREASHHGIRTTRAPLPFGRQSKWKKKMDGTVVKRES